MKTKDDSHDGDYRSLLILDEISKNEELTQLELSKRLGIAVGLTNSYIKNLVSKGYVTVSTIPKRRYAYYLTPKGFVAQTRLTYHHLKNFTNLYRVARRDFRNLFRDLKSSKVEKVVFCGVDEVTEIAYLSINEVNMELAGVLDYDKAGENFFGFKIIPPEKVAQLDFDFVVITRFKGGEGFFKALLDAGIAEEKIIDISKEGWIKRMEHES